MDPIDTSNTRLTFGGLASGLDTGAVIDALLDFERRPLLQLQNRQSDLRTSQSLIRGFNTMLLELRDAAAAIDNLTSTLTGPSLTEELLAFQASSSDESLATARATSDAQAGSFQVQVDELATVARRVSISVEDADAALSNRNRNFEIFYGDGQSIILAVPKFATMNELRDLINSSEDNDGSVRADVIFDGSGYRLTVSGEETGAANNLTITSNLKVGGTPIMDPSLGQDSKDAQLQYLGIPITRTSNDVTDLIPGVSLGLRGTGIVEIDVTRDDEAITEKITALVDAYNKVRDFSLEQSAVDPLTEEAGPLSGDSLLRNVEQTLQLSLGGLYTFADNPFSSLGQLGLRFDADGRLELDQDVLNAALDTDPRAVAQLLSGDGTTDGIATALGRALEPLVQSGDGVLAERDKAFDRSIDSLNGQIERLELRLEKREETLLLQFSRLETLISSLQGQSTYLAGLVTNTGSGGQS